MTNNNTTPDIVDELQSIHQFSSQAALSHVKASIALHSKHKRKRRIIQLSVFTSAAAMLLFILWFQFNNVSIYNSEAPLLAYNLPDGSTVDLNQGATIAYKRPFSKHRNLRLQGEAFFTIKHDIQHPFEIEVGQAQVKVLGTSFNIRQSSESETVEVLVATGKVLFSNGTFQAVELHPNEYAIAQASMNITKSQADINYMAWRNHRLVFEDSPLSYVISTLETAYHCQIKLPQERDKVIQYSSTFDQFTLDEILTSISLTFGWEIQKEASFYTFSEQE